MQFDKDLRSEYKDLFLKIRDFLLSHQGIQEFKKERITTYFYNNRGVCHVRTMPYGVDIGFLKGTKLNDKLDLLRGNGKAVRVLCVKGYNEIIINHFVKQAIAINNN